MTRADWLLVAVVALAAIPFQTLWLDFEAARRGVVMCLAAIACLVLAWPAKIAWPSHALIWLLLIVWTAAASADPINLWAVESRGFYLVALAVFLVVGAAVNRENIAKAAAIVVVPVSVYGLLQAAGLEWPSGYALNQAVSTLGNRNFASEFVAMCLAVVIASARPRPGWLTIATVLIGATYLGVNGSRSGLLAVFAVGAAAIFARGSIALAIIALCVSLAFGTLGGSNRGPVSATGPETSTVSPSTIEVRTEIWKAAGAMVLDAPIKGHGAGQFRFQYHRFRTDRERDLSSFGRKFATFVPNAHNDHIELAVEGGIPALVLWIMFLVAIWRRGWRARRLDLLPLIAFTLLACVRAPLANGPAALIAFLWFGSTVARSTIDSKIWRRVILVGVCVGLADTGIDVLRSQFGIAQFRATDPADPVARRAWTSYAFTDLSDPRVVQLALRDRWNSGDPGAEAAFSATTMLRYLLLDNDPHNPTVRLYLAEFANAARHHEESDGHLEALLRIDPPNPEGRLLAATRLIVGGQLDAGLDTLYTSLHPRLRAGLATHLRDLAGAFGVREKPGASARLEDEARLVEVVQALIDGADTPPILADDRDPRTGVIVAVRVLQRGDREAADARAPDRLDLTPAQRGLLAPLLDRLRELPRWAAALRED